MKSKEEIFKSLFELRCIPYRELTLKAMDEYGRQCFEAGIKACIHYYKDVHINPSYPFDIDKFWSDYLKELENEKRKD
jgi:hypothetical protein